MQHRSLAVRALATALAVATALPACALAQQAPPKPDPKPSLKQVLPPSPDRIREAGGAIVQAPMGRDSLKFDPLVRRGTLPNGMRYYVRRNVRPENRAELRLAVNAGALLEADDQRGLAHFAEHMAFNGTRRFEKAEIVNFLERIGMSFGADLNAYTAFDETVYMLTVPTDSAAHFRKSFQILADWANGVTFDTVEVNKERGVVIEEWRSRRGAQARVQDKQLPVLLQGSRYAERLPIGTPEGLQSFKQEALRRFYQDWYRPDMMAVVAVGDFNPDSVVSLIRREFAAIKPVAKPTRRPTYPVPGNDTTLFSVATDKELTSSNVQIVWKLPKRTEGTAAEYRHQLIEELADRMLNQRFTEIAQKPDAPFLAAGAGSAGFVRGADIYLLGATVREGDIIKGMEGILTEAERAARFGFTTGELSREKADMLRDYERAYAEREKTNSAAYAGEYVDAFLEKEPSPGIAVEYAIVQRDLPGITLEEVNAVAKSRLKDRDRVVLASAPEKEGLAAPTVAELKAAFERVNGSQQIAAYVDNATTGALVETPPTAGRVVATKQHPSVGVTEWTLSNGVRVLVKTTDFKADEVQMQAYSPGGSSLAPDSLVVPASFAATVAQIGGVGRFSQVDLQKALAGKAASVQAGIGELSEGLSGFASPKDLETMLQLVYLRFTAPRKDTTVYAATLQRIEAALKNRSAAPSEVFADTMTATLTQYSPRQPLPTPDLLRKMDLDRSLAFYRDRFADASDFTFVFVGNVTPEVLEPLAARWLASLPATGRKEKWIDRGVLPPPGVVEKVVKKGQEAKSNTRILFHGPAVATARERVTLGAMREVLNIRLREVLREDKGGTYGVGVGGGISALPTPRYTVGINFGTAPDKLEELTQAVWQVVDSLKKADITADELTKVKELQRRSRETSMKQNGWWAGRLVGAVQEGTPIDAFLAEEKLLEAVTPAAIRAAAQKYLDRSRYVRGSLYPDSWTSATRGTP